MPQQPSTEPELPVRVGELLAGKYRVERILGRGGMGIVVAAMHEQLQELVAIKLLLPGVTGRSDFTQRFVREARAAVKIKSAHVARVLDVDTLPDGRLYMVMEYLAGRDLAQLLSDRGPLPEGEAVDYILQVCEALAEAHTLGIVHRDLKPSNLFLTETGSGITLVKVLDFGISKVTGVLVGGTTDDQHLTGDTALMGSPLYMSPEQIRSAKHVDARSDVWSLGVILHELLTGRTPFTGDSHMAVLASIAADPPTLLREHRANASPALEAIIAQCLEKDAAKRIPSVLDLARALGPMGDPDAVPSVERAVRGAGRTSFPGHERRSTSRSDARISIPVDAMAETVHTLDDTSHGKMKQLIVAAATALGGLVAVGTVAFLTSRPPALAPADLSVRATAVPTEAPSAAAIVATADPPVAEPSGAPRASGAAATHAPSAATVSGTAPGAPAGAPTGAASIPSSAPLSSFSSAPAKPAGSTSKPSLTSKPGEKTPSPSPPNGGIRLGKEVDTRH